MFRIWLREMRTTNSYAHSEARKMLRRFSSQLIHLFAKWNAAPDPALGINLPMMRDFVFGSLEHIVWTAACSAGRTRSMWRGCRATWRAPICARSA